MNKESDMMNLADRLLTVMVCLSVAIVIYFLMQTTTVCTFRIPTDSMQPALQPGDNILINKWVMGARIFDIWEAAEEKEVEIYRLPGLGKVKRNDVLVFHYPYPRSNDSLSMHLLKYYVKRCIALPGDT
ncbi:MAG: signal peptidase I, partial [Bacteroidaceae bacterium]|nr:signal peptidase I [Bacteroidaceae bacterium]